MKTIKLLLLSLLSLFAFVACSSDDKDPQSKVAPTKELWVDLEMKPDTEGFRLLQNVSASGSVTTPFMGNATSLKVLLCVTRSGASAPVYQELSLTIPASEAKTVADQTDTYYTTIHPKYSGKITVPSDGSGAYTLSAVILDYDVEAGGAVATSSDYKSVERVNNVVSKIVVTSANQIGGKTVAQASATEPILIQYPTNGTSGSTTPIDFKVPYIAEPISVALAASGDALEAVSLSFKPSGRLLRFSVTNATTSAVTFTKLKIKTNAFFSDWDYNLSELSAGNLLQGYRTDLNAWERTYTIDLTASAGSSATDYLGLWVMPNKTQTGLSTQVYLVDASGAEVLAFESTNRLGDKGTQRINLAYAAPAPNGFPNGKLPYEYFVGLAENLETVAGTAVNINDLKTQPAAGVSFDESSIVYMNHTTANTTVQSNTNYKIPTMHELAGIFPGSEGNISRAIENTMSYSDFKETISVGGETNDYLADYASFNGVVYGVRFQDPTAQDKSKRMIYRYRYWGTFGNPGYHLEVNMKYIGADDTYDTPEKLIAAGDVAFVDAYTLYFPGTGNTTTTYRNKIRGLLTTTGRYHSNSGTNIPIHSTSLIGTTNRYPVPLFTKL